MLNKVTKSKEEISNYFEISENPFEHAMYQFYKKEIKPNDVKITHTDISIIGNSKKERKYLCAIWKIPNYHNAVPWIRLGIPDDDGFSSLELVLPVFHGDLPEFWSRGKSYFRLGMEFKIGKHGPTLQFFTNPVDIHDITEILSVITIFTRKIKSYATIK